MNANTPRPSACRYLNEIHEMMLDSFGLPKLNEKKLDVLWEILWFSHYTNGNQKEK